MPKMAKELGPLDIKRAAHPGTHERNIWVQVGGVSGLILQVSPGNAKSWLLRTLIGGKRRAVGLGAYPEVSLAEARDRARQAKAKVRDGIDPIEERKATRAALAAAQRRTLTMADALEMWIEAKGAQIGNEKAIKYLRSTFETYAAAEVGRIAVSEIETRDILRVLQPIWLTKTETARKLRMRFEAILNWAAVAGHRPHDAPNPARWNGNLAELLPRPDAVAKGANQPAIAQADLPAWWAALAKRGGMGAAALRFACLCASRSGEVRGARWEEIDLEAGLWIVPADRMKMKREHRVARSPDAVALLRDLPRAESDLVFWAPRGGALSDMTLSKVMRDMQADAERAEQKAGEPVEKAGWRDLRTGRPAVPHGLRSSFRDWAADHGVDHTLAELALAHDVGDATERAYRRTDLLERRRQVMSQWSDFLHGRAAETVVPFPAPLAVRS
ncbi:integrase arm-type DNA-binding domain-containing protein [Rhodobacter capsulatus]|nr:integrase [Rhodobacter capsulatus]KQB17864.1 integrase [Rhodobacter capsulatus]PZX27515.1 integrase [Rhodobacter capsulatus]QNR64895.1 integrase arm-type DNA-binding domain-containing protein [Rhodobacter capsulatus]